MSKVQRIYRSKEEKRKIIAKYRKSGLSACGYASRNGISAGNIIRWDKQFEGAREARVPLIRVAPDSSHESVCRKAYEIELEIKDGILLRVRTV